MSKLFIPLIGIGSKIFQLGCLFTLLVAGLDYFGLIKASKVALTLILTLSLGLAVVIPLLALLVAFVFIILKKD